MGMFQFTTEDAAIQAARLLAIRQARPILVMVSNGGHVFSIGPWENKAVRQAGSYVATVYGSGHVDYQRITQSYFLAAPAA
jgi:hypothetical protein